MTEYNLPEQTQLQQASARPVSGEELNTFGKHAAALYAKGEATSLNDAVVYTVKHAGLSPEQVKRVVEFANTAAYLDEFKKEGTSTKYVHFDHGPADPSEVLKELNSGGGGTVFDRGLMDYAHTPEVHKTASAFGLHARNMLAMEKVAGVSLTDLDTELSAVFGVPSSGPVYTNPFQDVDDARAKLAAARDAVLAEISGEESVLLGINRDLFHIVKQAALAGTPLGHVVQAWHQVLHPAPELVKSAFSLLGKQLVDNGVFGYAELGESLTKTAGALAVNEEHPVISCFAAYCQSIEKLAQLRVAYEECTDGIGRLDTFRKLAQERITQEQEAAHAREKQAHVTHRQEAIRLYEPQGREIV